MKTTPSRPPGAKPRCQLGSLDGTVDGIALPLKHTRTQPGVMNPTHISDRVPLMRDQSFLERPKESRSQV